MTTKLNFICFSINNWEKRKARKQQFMTHLSQRDDVGEVLYVEPPMNILRLLFFWFSELSNPDNRLRWKRALTVSRKPLTDKLSIYTPLFFLPFSSRIQAIHNINLRISTLILKRRLTHWDFGSTVIWIYHPFDYILLSLFPVRALSVFDWAEEWSVYFTEFSDARRRQIRLLEEQIIKAVDIVFVCSQRMISLAQPLNKNSYHILDGTIYGQFQHKPAELPADIRDIPRPIVGYLGTINRRIDLNLLERLAAACPQVSFVYIGDVHYQYLDISPLQAHGNVHFLRGKDYSELGIYASCTDVWILPYKPELTPSSPTKIFDYLATGKPTVSTDLIEIQRFKDIIYIAKDNDSFVLLTGAALKESSEELRNKRQLTARKNSWDARANEIMDIIHNKIAGER
jgi:hypothetical protein